AAGRGRRRRRGRRGRRRRGRPGGRGRRRGRERRRRRRRGRHVDRTGRGRVDRRRRRRRPAPRGRPPRRPPPLARVRAGPLGRRPHPDQHVRPVTPGARPRTTEGDTTMARPITLFTGQWADLPFEEVARLASGWGYDGLEIACWGDHLDPWRWDDDEYVQGKLDLLAKYDLKVYAISNHLKGQAVCDDPIDQRHRDILPDVVWGDGDPEGVRQRAAEEMKHTARIAAKLGVKTVVGFTGSAIWKYVAMFPPVSQEAIDAGYQDFADRWNPILDVFDEVGVRFAHEVHPSEIAYDYWTTVRTLEAIGHREAFGLNWDPSHMVWQDIDP